MTCDETAALLTDRLYGVLIPDDERRLEDHLAGCASCRREADGLAAMWTEMAPGTRIGIAVECNT